MLLTLGANLFVILSYKSQLYKNGELRRILKLVDSISNGIMMYICSICASVRLPIDSIFCTHTEQNMLLERRLSIECEC